MEFGFEDAQGSRIRHWLTSLPASRLPSGDPPEFLGPDSYPDLTALVMLLIPAPITSPS